MPAQLFAALVQIDALVERDIAAFETPDDTLKLAQGLLEAHLGNM
tara:strand:+ start:1482 stop:1616 length:135 start_codon:yes stop_codon:yes gene_type:complete